MRFRRHPSAKALQRWLDDGTAPDVEVDDHVADCDRCATRLEELAQPLPTLTDALSRTLQAPDDLVQRLGVRMNTTIRNREDLRLFFELMGVPFATVRSLMEDDTE